MNNIELHYATLLEVADVIKSRKISSVELTQIMLDRISKLEPQLHAYATITPEFALAQAVQADEEIAQGKDRGPLHGVPVAVKDICNTAGIVTAAGMSIHAEYVPDFDSTVVKRLAAAGAVLLGKLQLTEGASIEHHPTITPPRNPWDANYWSGASSSGSGVATAAGMCFGSLGSDTGGSIRFPASSNGITGLKPTFGRVSRHGTFAFANSLDHIGPMTRSAADAGAMLGAIAGPDPDDATTLSTPVPDYLAGLTSGIKGLRIGIDLSYNEFDVGAEIIAMLHESRKVLEKLGATIKEVHIPNPEAVVDTWLPYCAVEAAIVHEATYPARASEYGLLARLLDLGRSVRSIDLMKAHHARLAFTGALATFFSDIDLLLIPTQPLANVTIERKDKMYADQDELSAFLRFVTPFDMAGSPTITLPGGFTSQGLPLTFQLVSRHLEEGMLVRAGHAYQQETDWHRRHPTL